MPQHIIRHFRLVWDYDQNVGAVFLNLDQDSAAEVELTNVQPDSFAAICAVLREAPVFYDPGSKQIWTNWEPRA